METSIIRYGKDSDSRKTMPDAPPGKILIRVVSKQEEARWEHTYTFDSRMPDADDGAVIDGSAIRTFVAESDQFTPPPPDEGWELVIADNPRQISTNKWVHRFHYRPISIAPR